jgi:hypothetical protein
MAEAADSLVETPQRVDDAGERRRKHRHKRKRKSRKQEKLMRNVIWLGGGLAVGLPLLAAMLYAMSR